MKSLTIILACLLLLSSCATQPEALGNNSGFLIGIWHGLIIWFSFIGSIFMDIRIYEYPNSGFWYDFGFILGVSLIIGGGGAASS